MIMTKQQLQFHYNATNNYYELNNLFSGFLTIFIICLNYLALVVTYKMRK